MIHCGNLSTNMYLIYSFFLLSRYLNVFSYELIQQNNIIPYIDFPEGATASVSRTILNN